MLFGQHKRFMLLQESTYKLLRDNRVLLPKLSSSSFSSKLTKPEHNHNLNSFNLTRSLLASVSDSHKYFISSQLLIINPSTSLRYLITPLHTSYVSPDT
ncbi:hypothetical protein HanXRQr2_Chr13g0618241 [Helianthus annuus]|uniref:Uncharacterized protein n=1 Tax=Helianthus annuus TaxID=4232 RepID=A0A9K3HE73_HELAN|nr:hypothetical protein HanXRQr2_Chr13g0618241 [Helianthus annuus]